MESKASILLVDDRPDNLVALESCLASLGQNLVKARSGEEALRCLLGQDFAAIVLDVHMPGMDGFETAQWIRQREKSKYTPIIFVTAIHRSEEDVMRGYSLGGVDYVFSPYPRDVLNAKVSAIVDLFKYAQQVKRQATRLAAANRELEEEIAARQRAEAEVRKLNTELEQRVLERTAQLEKSNRDLQTELLERRRVEKALRESERNYRTLVENIPQRIFMKSREHRYVSVNENYARDLGKLPADLQGKADCDFLPKDLVEKYHADEERIMETGVTDEVDEEFLSGSERRIKHCIKTPVRDENGGVIGVLGVFWDVTERKRLEEQLRQAQKMEVIGRLAGGVAHDFNNLLTIITGYGQLVMDGLDAAHPLRKEVEEIVLAGERAAALTRQLLAFSRRQVLSPRVLDLSAVVAGMDKMLTRLIGEDIQIETHLEGNLGRVKADPGQIEQVIMNLAINARDAMPNGGKLVIETANVELDAAYAHRHGRAQTGSFVMLAVSDTGCGMDAEMQTHLFEPFFTTKELGKGTGLGLATVYGIVKQTGGDIWVYSELGRGSTFKVYLPRVEEAAESVTPTQPGKSAACGSETILLVEDESGVRKLACSVLEAKGYHVVKAGNGEEALKVAQAYEASIDLLLTDLVMPQMGGEELAGRLLALRPSMKVIFMSGYTDKVGRQLEAQGVLGLAVPFLQKPFTPDGLARKIRMVLDASPGPERP